eukprot:TRINITY_DN65827_c0_g1_i1.p2 TRINITY_DN65827_c0_g1~~TRINITY_DN65827_c0_g1_i1.p2  ORF type:complete len:210 (+),score=73.67 TRINITY_DN65827_c0_g1_i1:142-771(+)
MSADGSALYKVLVVGNGTVGKTSIIRRYCANVFQLSTKQTIGVDFALKVVPWDGGQITLQIWDVAGQERYTQVTRVYYQGAVGALICFDIHNSESFQAVARWKKSIDSQVFLPNGNPIPCILVANKCDKGPLSDVISQEEIDKFCAEHNFAACFETSAMTDIGITPAFEKMIDVIVTNDDTATHDYSLSKGKALRLNRESPKPEKKCSC